MVDSLADKLKDDPNNFEGWMRLVRSYAVLGQKDKAADALKQGLAAFPADGSEGKQLLALAGELGLKADGGRAMTRKQKRLAIIGGGVSFIAAAVLAGDVRVQPGGRLFLRAGRSRRRRDLPPERASGSAGWSRTGR